MENSQQKKPNVNGPYDMDDKNLEKQDKMENKTLSCIPNRKKRAPNVHSLSDTKVIETEESEG